MKLLYKFGKVNSLKNLILKKTNLKLLLFLFHTLIPILFSAALNVFAPILKRQGQIQAQNKQTIEIWQTKMREGKQSVS